MWINMDTGQPAEHTASKQVWCGTAKEYEEFIQRTFYEDIQDDKFYKTTLLPVLAMFEEQGLE